MLSLPKPETLALVKARNRREEAKIVRQVRAAVAERDGHCRILFGVPVNGDTHNDTLNECGQRSEWAHLEDKRRFKTRGMEPEQRHTSQDSAMLCDLHHDLYDKRELTLRFLTELGADGPIAWKRT